MKETIIMSVNKNEIIKIKKLPVEQLKEILEREQNILKNTKLVLKLSDNGQSLRELCHQIENEIEFRKNLDKIQDSLSSISINDDNKSSSVDDNKYVEHMCKVEKSPYKNIFRPFSMMKTKQDVKSTKLISLGDSMVLLKQQSQRLKEEQMKMKFKREFEANQSDGDDDDADDSGGESSDSKSDDSDHHEHDVK